MIDPSSSGTRIRTQLSAKLRLRQYANLHDYDRINVFIEPLHRLYPTGKRLFPRS